MSHFSSAHRLAWLGPGFLPGEGLYLPSSTCSSAKGSWRSLFHHWPLCMQFSTGCQLTPFCSHPRGGVIKGHTTISGRGQGADATPHSTHLFLLITSSALLPSSAIGPNVKPFTQLSSLSLSFRCFSVLLPSPSGLLPSIVFPPAQPDSPCGFVLSVFSTESASPSL